MTVISMKDYAAKKNISYEAVRQQVVRYKEDLDGHIIKDGRQQFLDEEAVAFLDAKRQKNPVAIIQQSKDEAIEQLRGEKENLLLKVADLQDQLLRTMESAHQAQLAAARVDLLEAAAADREARIQQTTAELQASQEAALQAQADQRAAELAAEELRAALKEREAALAAEAAARAEAEAALQAERSKTWLQRLLGR